VLTHSGPPLVAWPASPAQGETPRQQDLAFYRQLAGSVRTRLLNMGRGLWTNGVLRQPAQASALTALLGPSSGRAAKLLHLLRICGLLEASGDPLDPTLAPSPLLVRWSAGAQGDRVGAILEHTRTLLAADWGSCLRGDAPGPTRPDGLRELILGPHQGAAATLRALGPRLDPLSTPRLLVVGGDAALCEGLLATAPQLEEIHLLSLPGSAPVRSQGPLKARILDPLRSPWPTGFQAALLPGLLDRYGPGDCAELLRKANASLEPGGQLLATVALADSAPDLALLWEGLGLFDPAARAGELQPGAGHVRAAERAGLGAPTLTVDPRGLGGLLEARSTRKRRPPPAPPIALRSDPHETPALDVVLRPVRDLPWPAPLPGEEPGSERALLALLAGALRTRLLETAVDSGLLGSLAEGPLTPLEVSGRLGLHLPCAAKWLHLLAVAGVLEVRRATPAPIRRGAGSTGASAAPGYTRSSRAQAWFGAAGRGGFYQELLELNRWSLSYDWDAVLGGCAVEGGIQWPPRATADAEVTEGLMERSVEGPLRVLRERFDPRAHRRVLDMGGGNGSLGLAMTGQFPDVERWCVVNLPEGARLAGERIARAVAAGAPARVEVHAADFLEDPLPTGFDTVLFSRVLNDWSPRISSLLLHKARAALGEGGSLIIVECFADGAEDFVLSWEGRYLLYDSMDPFVFKPLSLYAQLATQAGFRNVRGARDPSGLYGILFANT
jgi:O-methyltransferase domain